LQWFHDNFENIATLVCATNKKGSNCLHVACQKGHLKLAQFLIQELKIPINCQNNSGNTPFHMACENGHIALAQWLSENGAALWV
jgi:ankyrin repeat protein